MKSTPRRNSEHLERTAFAFYVIPRAAKLLLVAVATVLAFAMIVMALITTRFHASLGTQTQKQLHQTIER